MSDVKRYDHWGDYCGPQCGFEEDVLGDWVGAADYDALLAERDALRDALQGMVDFYGYAEQGPIEAARAALQGEQP